MSLLFYWGYKVDSSRTRNAWYIELKQNNILFIVLPQIAILFIISIHSNTGEKWISWLNRLKVWWHLCHSLWYLLFLQSFTQYNHTFFHLSSYAEACLLVSSSLLRSPREEPPPMGRPVKNRTRACLTAAAIPTELRRVPGLSLLFTKILNFECPLIVVFRRQIFGPWTTQNRSLLELLWVVSYRIVNKDETTTQEELFWHLRGGQQVRRRI